MNLTEQPKLLKTGLKRLGRGHGSGRGKTSGRGTKGQKARRNISLAFEGGALPLVKRLPFLRGRGRNAVIRQHPLAVKLGYLNALPAKTVVDVASLVKNSIIQEKAGRYGVKIISGGDLKVALDVKVPVTAGAKAQIEKAGGQVTA